MAELRRENIRVGMFELKMTRKVARADFMY